MATGWKRKICTVPYDKTVSIIQSIKCFWLGHYFIVSSSDDKDASGYSKVWNSHAKHCFRCGKLL